MWDIYSDADPFQEHGNARSGANFRTQMVHADRIDRQGHCGSTEVCFAYDQ